MKRFATALPWLALAFGAAFLIRAAPGILASLIAGDLPLNNAQWGLLSAAYATSWAVSGALAPQWLRYRHQPRVLSMLLLGLATLTWACSLSTSFSMLLWLRVAGGLASGPVLPMVQAMAADLASVQRRGLGMGLVQGIGGSLGAGILGPMLLTHLADGQGWRFALQCVAALTLLCGIGVLMLVRTPDAGRVRNAALPASPVEHCVSARSTQLWLCCLIGAAMVGWLMLGVTFFPLYLARHAGIDAAQLGIVLGAGGAGSLIASVLAAALTDRFSARAVMTAFALTGVIAPLALLLDVRSTSALAVAFAAGNFAGGTFPLFLAVLPARGQPAASAALRIGRVQAVSELAGGVLVPAVMGPFGDRFGLGCIVAAAASLAIISALLAQGLRERVSGYQFRG